MVLVACRCRFSAEAASSLCHHNRSQEMSGLAQAVLVRPISVPRRGDPRNRQHGIWRHSYVATRHHHVTVLLNGVVVRWE